MTEMLMAADAARGTLAEVAVGSLVLVYGYSFPGLPGFVIQDDKGVNEVFLVEGPRLGGAALDSRTPVISLGQAIARFDRSSFASIDALLPTNTLVIGDDGIGVYEASDFAPRGGTLALLTGQQSGFYRNHEVPAFLHWELGYLRDDEFVPVCEIELRS